MTKKYKHGITVMRMQPFHNGHLKIIDKMKKECEHVTVLIGSAQEQRTGKNPFSFEERRDMVEPHLKDTNYHILPIEDINRPDIWDIYVIGKVASELCLSTAGAIYYCGEIETTNKALANVIVLRTDEISGTFIRKQFFTAENFRTIQDINEFFCDSTKIEELYITRDKFSQYWENMIPSSTLEIMQKHVKERYGLV